MFADVGYTEKIFDFKKCDYNQLNLELSKIQRSNVFGNEDDINCLLEKFYNVIYELIYKYVPERTVHSSKFPKWFSPELIRATIIKKINHRKYKEFVCENSKYQFEEQRKLCNYLSNRDFERMVESYNIYTDIKKAFDSINHKLLIFKLEKYGIKNNMLNWFRSYLENRTQKLKIRNHMSNKIIVTSGAPQGSHFGALLYIIYINDVVKVVENSKILLYTDDLKLYKRINNQNDIYLLNKDLVNLNNWNKQNNLDFNEFKCKVMIFGKEISDSNFKFSINNQDLEYVKSIKDLGIIFDNKLTFKDHINSVISKSKKALWLLKYHTKGFKNREAIIHLYNTLVKSKLLFGSVVWNTYNNELIYNMEKVQNDFLRYMPYKMNIKFDYFNHNYLDIQNNLEIMSLQSSRNFHDLVFVYKLFNNKIDLLSIKLKISLQSINQKEISEIENLYLVLIRNILIKNTLKLKTNQLYID